VTAQTQRTARDIALEYVQRGWNPVPIPFRTKIPVGEGWQKRVIREEDVPKYFNCAPQNVGVILGPSSGGLTDIDLDSREAIAIAPFVLPKTGAIFGRPSARAAHWLYVTDLAKLEDNTEDKSVLKFSDSALFRQQTGGKAVIVELRMGGSKGAQNRLSRINARERRGHHLGRGRPARCC
jgi:bifunctional DNA primase/polymerase-like protein